MQGLVLAMTLVMEYDPKDPIQGVATACSKILS